MAVFWAVAVDCGSLSWGTSCQSDDAGRRHGQSDKASTRCYSKSVERKHPQQHQHQHQRCSYSDRRGAASCEDL